MMTYCHSERQRRFFFLLAFSLLLSLAGCKRMPLYDKEKTLELKLSLNLKLQVDVDISINTDIVMEAATINVPDYLKACFYLPENNKMTYSTFVESSGGELSLASGIYDCLVYSFGTEYVQIRGEGDINTIEAFTSDITDLKKSTLTKFASTKSQDDPIIFAPDHLLVAQERVEIPEFSGQSQTITIYATATTIVETYSFEVHSVIGAEYIESAEAFVTNQASSSFFGRGEVNPTPATIYFPIGVDRTKGCLYTVFNTFGKLPGTSESYLHILIKDTGGQEYTITTDITDQFENPEHHIVIEEEVERPEPEAYGGGGIAPTVDPWNEENHDVPIG